LQGEELAEGFNLDYYETTSRKPQLVEDIFEGLLKKLEEKGEYGLSTRASFTLSINNTKTMNSIDSSHSFSSNNSCCM